MDNQLNNKVIQLGDEVIQLSNTVKEILMLLSELDRVWGQNGTNNNN